MTGRLEWLATMNALVNGVITGVPASVASSGLILCFFTANWRIAAVATATIIGVISSFFISFVLAGWELGVYECMFLQLTTGMALLGRARQSGHWHRLSRPGHWHRQ
ncbi:hypothetical protein T484DRAFT_1819493 [Baffinella frigidus]|nr:hypothetical protein T484DRAFT_1819493 [Cryptophyta sp. CCMP2293]